MIETVSSVRDLNSLREHMVTNQIGGRWHVLFVIA